MTVCACQNIGLDEIVDIMEKIGNDSEAIRVCTRAGKGCGECLKSSCADVDLPFPHALINAEMILKQRRNH